GNCDGSQLSASALDAKVYAGGTQEIGWSTVEITAEGMTDKVFSSLGLETAEVFQWHGDTFDIPKKSVLLASSSLYTNQAFRYGSNVYGLQFHIEVSPEIIEEWFTSNPGVNLAAMLDHANKIYPDYRERAQLFYERFFA
ncbi:glutamine amidotransferase, partial [bacterium]|nr:glutamine amidotransferase [bacterium]